MFDNVGDMLKPNAISNNEAGIEPQKFYACLFRSVGCNIIARNVMLLAALPSFCFSCKWQIGVPSG